MMTPTRARGNLYLQVASQPPVQLDEKNLARVESEKKVQQMRQKKRKRETKLTSLWL